MDYSKAYSDLMRPSPMEAEHFVLEAVKSLDHARDLLRRECLLAKDEDREALNIAHKVVGKLITKLHPDPDAYWDEKLERRRANMLKMFSFGPLSAHERDCKLTDEKS